MSWSSLAAGAGLGHSQDADVALSSLGGWRARVADGRADVFTAAAR